MAKGKDVRVSVIFKCTSCVRKNGNRRNMPLGWN